MINIVKIIYYFFLIWELYFIYHGLQISVGLCDKSFVMIIPFKK